MAWCFVDEADDYTVTVLQRLRVDSAFVPGIWPLEVANVLLAAERRGRMDPARSARFLELVRGLPMQVQWGPGLDHSPALFDVARRRRLSAYDAAYVSLAAGLDLALASKDAKPADAAADLHNQWTPRRTLLGTPA
jgi:predicted nucleic acid-binding protein